MKPFRTFRIPLLLFLLFYVSILKGNGVPHSFFGGSSYLTTGRIVDDSVSEIYLSVKSFSFLFINPQLLVRLPCLMTQLVIKL